jgi:hypothetical protein
MHTYMGCGGRTVPGTVRYSTGTWYQVRYQYCAGLCSTTGVPLRLPTEANPAQTWDGRILGMREVHTPHDPGKKGEIYKLDLEHGWNKEFVQLQFLIPLSFSASTTCMPRRESRIGRFIEEDGLQCRCDTTYPINELHGNSYYLKTSLIPFRQLILPLCKLLTKRKR